MNKIKISAKKKSQIKLGESIFIMFIFFILMVMGLMFYTNYELSSINKLKEIDVQRERIMQVYTISSLPEISCTNLQGDFMAACFDAYKLQVFSETMMMQSDKPEEIEKAEKFKEYYFDMFGKSKIYIKETYPLPNEYYLFNMTINKKSKKETRVPVIIRHPFEDVNSFGYLVVVTSDD